VNGVARVIGALALFVVPLDIVAAQATDLSDAASSFAEAWAKGDAPALEDGPDSHSVVVELLGEEHGSMDPRKAASALGRFLGAHESRGASVTRVSEVGGTPARGFAEVRWEAVMPGTSELLVYTVFAGFVRQEDRWRVSEIRVLR
jgi:hypothetical protein